MKILLLQNDDFRRLLVKSPSEEDGYEAVGDKDSEWLFIDPDHRDR